VYVWLPMQISIISWAVLVKEILQCMASSAKSQLLSELVLSLLLAGDMLGLPCWSVVRTPLSLDPSDGVFGRSRRRGTPLAVATPSMLSIFIAE